MVVKKGQPSKVTTTNGSGRSDRFSLLTETSAGTPMGELLRKYWQPVAISSDVKPGRAKSIRVLGEDLALYRGESGAPYIVGGRCAHRRTLLHSGWIEGETIRCMYHGWRYDCTGQCVEMPAEDQAFAAKIKIPAYVARDYAGVVFAYLGEGPAPEFDLPVKAQLDSANVSVPSVQTWPCNWLQGVENSLDAVHVNFVHRTGRVGALGTAVTTALPNLEYLETDAGVRQIATRGDNNVRISDWTFPNNNHILAPSPFPNQPWVDTFIWMIPIDDHNMMRIMVLCASVAEEDASRLQEYLEVHSDYDPANDHDALLQDRAYPEEHILELTAAQDYVAQVGQGPIADRENEHLGQSDLGVITLRKIFWRELDKLQGGSPLKEWKRLVEAVEMPIQPGG